MQRYGQDIECDMRDIIKRDNGPYVLYSEATNPIKIAEELNRQGFVVVTKDQWDQQQTALAELNEIIEQMRADYKAALAEKETANEILRNMNKRFCEEHEVLRRQITMLKAENLNLYEASRKTIDRQAEQIAELEAEVIRMKEHTWCAYCGYEIHIDDEAATKISEHILSCKKHPINIALADNKRQAEEIARLREALQRILDYGNRTWKEEIAQAALKSEPLGDEFQKVLNTVPYESESEAIKAFYDPKNDNMSCKEFKEKYPEKGDQGEDDNAKT